MTCKEGKDQHIIRVQPRPGGGAKIRVALMTQFSETRPEEPSLGPVVDEAGCHGELMANGRSLT